MGLLPPPATFCISTSVQLLFVPLWHQRLSLQREIRRLDAEIVRLEALEKQQQAEIEALKNDPLFVERVARSMMNLAKPGETIIIFTNTVPRSPR